MFEPKKLEFDDNVMIVHFKDGSVKHIDMLQYLPEWDSISAQKLLKNIKTDLIKGYLEDGYAITWPGYNFSIDPEILYEDAVDGYPQKVSAKLISALQKIVKKP
jgi:hypothetical protein